MKNRERVLVGGSRKKPTNFLIMLLNHSTHPLGKVRIDAH